MADDTRCARCGEPKSAHMLVNFADGPQVGAPTLICPFVVFHETVGPYAHANAVAKEMPAKHLRVEEPKE